MKTSKQLHPSWVMKFYSAAIQFLAMAFTCGALAQQTTHFPLGFNMTPQERHDLIFKNVRSNKDRHRFSNLEISQLQAMTPRSHSLLTTQEVKVLFNETEHNSVVGLNDEAKNKYDPDYTIGFCFGRAEYVYRRALAMGAAPDSVVKIFVFGPLIAPAHELRWSFHVATMIFTKDIGWVAVDTGLMIGYPVRVADWKDHVDTYLADRDIFGRTKALNYIVSTPDRIFPDQKESTNISSLRDLDYSSVIERIMTTQPKDAVIKDRQLSYLRDMYRSIDAQVSSIRCELAFNLKKK